MLIEYRTYKMSTEYLKIVKIAMEASFVKDYDEQFVYAPSMNSESGVITCVYPPFGTKHHIYCYDRQTVELSSHDCRSRLSLKRIHNKYVFLLNTETRQNAAHNPLQWYYSDDDS